MKSRRNAKETLNSVTKRCYFSLHIKAKRHAIDRKQDSYSDTGQSKRYVLLAEGDDKLTDAELLAIFLRVGQGTFREGVMGRTPPILPGRSSTNMAGLPASIEPMCRTY
jgi:hypothetical protein